ncbi:MAG: hypothetical protein HQ580_19620, partial [Planctomycetes bacterium]|nr:hypothetical protein [Planctomycetota bacterium]
LADPDESESERQLSQLYEHLSRLGIKMTESVLYPVLHSLMTRIEATEGAVGSPEHKRFLRATDCFGRSRWLTDYKEARPLYQELEKILFDH